MVEPSFSEGGHFLHACIDKFGSTYQIVLPHHALHCVWPLKEN